MAFRELVPWRRKDLTAERGEETPFHALQREMNRILDRFTRGWSWGWGELAEREEPWGGFFPSVDVSETDKEIHITAELPGLDEKDLDLSLSGNNLIIRGEKKAEKEEKGVLKIRLPKSPEAQKARKKIPIH
jgi:HSP20 family protein